MLSPSSSNAHRGVKETTFNNSGLPTERIYVRRFFSNHPHFLTSAQIKPKLFQSRQNYFSTRGGRASCLRACFDATLLLKSQTFRRALTASVDSYTDIRGVPLQWRNQVWQSLEERCRKARLGGVCAAEGTLECKN